MFKIKTLQAFIDYIFCPSIEAATQYALNDNWIIWGITLAAPYAVIIAVGVSLKYLVTMLINKIKG